MTTIASDVNVVTEFKQFDLTNVITRDRILNSYFQNYKQNALFTFYDFSNATVVSFPSLWYLFQPYDYIMVDYGSKGYDIQIKNTVSESTLVGYQAQLVSDVGLDILNSYQELTVSMWFNNVVNGSFTDGDLLTFDSFKISLSHDAQNSYLNFQDQSQTNQIIISDVYNSSYNHLTLRKNASNVVITLNNTSILTVAHTTTLKLMRFGFQDLFVSDFRFYESYMLDVNIAFLYQQNINQRYMGQTAYEIDKFGSMVFHHSLSYYDSQAAQSLTVVNNSAYNITLTFWVYRKHKDDPTAAFKFFSEASDNLAIYEKDNRVMLDIMLQDGKTYHFEDNKPLVSAEWNFIAISFIYDNQYNVFCCNFVLNNYQPYVTSKIAQQPYYFNAAFELTTSIQDDITLIEDIAIYTNAMDTVGILDLFIKYNNTYYKKAYNKTFTVKEYYVPIDGIPRFFNLKNQYSNPLLFDPYSMKSKADLYLDFVTIDRFGKINNSGTNSMLFAKLDPATTNYTYTDMFPKCITTSLGVNIIHMEQLLGCPSISISSWVNIPKTEDYTFLSIRHVTDEYSMDYLQLFDSNETLYITIQDEIIETPYKILKDTWHNLSLNLTLVETNLIQMDVFEIGMQGLDREVTFSSNTYDIFFTSNLEQFDFSNVSNAIFAEGTNALTASFEFNQYTLDINNVISQWFYPPYLNTYIFYDTFNNTKICDFAIPDSTASVRNIGSYGRYFDLSVQDGLNSLTIFPDSNIPYVSDDSKNTKNIENGYYKLEWTSNNAYVYDNTHIVLKNIDSSPWGDEKRKLTFEFSIKNLAQYQEVFELFGANTLNRYGILNNTLQCTLHYISGIPDSVIRLYYNKEFEFQAYFKIPYILIQEEWYIFDLIIDNTTRSCYFTDENIKNTNKLVFWTNGEIHNNQFYFIKTDINDPPITMTANIMNNDNYQGLYKTDAYQNMSSLYWTGNKSASIIPNNTSAYITTNNIFLNNGHFMISFWMRHVNNTFKRTVTEIFNGVPQDTETDVTTKTFQVFKLENTVKPVDPANNLSFEMVLDANGFFGIHYRGAELFVRYNSDWNHYGFMVSSDTLLMYYNGKLVAQHALDNNTDDIYYDLTLGDPNNEWELHLADFSIFNANHFEMFRFFSRDIIPQCSIANIPMTGISFYEEDINKPYLINNNISLISDVLNNDLKINFSFQPLDNMPHDIIKIKLYDEGYKQNMPRIDILQYNNTIDVLYIQDNQHYSCHSYDIPVDIADKVHDYEINLSTGSSELHFDYLNIDARPTYLLWNIGLNDGTTPLTNTIPYNPASTTMAISFWYVPSTWDATNTVFKLSEGANDILVVNETGEFLSVTFNANTYDYVRTPYSFGRRNHLELWLSGGELSKLYINGHSGHLLAGPTTPNTTMSIVTIDTYTALSLYDVRIRLDPPMPQKFDTKEGFIIGENITRAIIGEVSMSSSTKVTGATDSGNAFVRIKGPPITTNTQNQTLTNYSVANNNHTPLEYYLDRSPYLFNSFFNYFKMSTVFFYSLTSLDTAYDIVTFSTGPKRLFRVFLNEDGNIAVGLSLFDKNKEYSFACSKPVEMNREYMYTCIVYFQDRNMFVSLSISEPSMILLPPFIIENRIYQLENDENLDYKNMLNVPSSIHLSNEHGNITQFYIFSDIISHPDLYRISKNDVYRLKVVASNYVAGYQFIEIPRNPLTPSTITSMNQDTNISPTYKDMYSVDKNTDPNKIIISDDANNTIIQRFVKFEYSVSFWEQVLEATPNYSVEFNMTDNNNNMAVSYVRSKSNVMESFVLGLPAVSMDHSGMIPGEVSFCSFSLRYNNFKYDINMMYKDINEDQFYTYSQTLDGNSIHSANNLVDPFISLIQSEHNGSLHGLRITSGFTDIDTMTLLYDQNYNKFTDLLDIPVKGYDMGTLANSSASLELNTLVDNDYYTKYGANITFTMTNVFNGVPITMTDNKLQTASNNVIVTQDGNMLNIVADSSTVDMVLDVLFNVVNSTLNLTKPAAVRVRIVNNNPVNANLSGQAIV